MGPLFTHFLRYSPFRLLELAERSNIDINLPIKELIHNLIENHTQFSAHMNTQSPSEGLVWAASEGRTHMVKWLLDQKNIYADTPEASRALSLAKKGGYEEIVKMLLDYGVVNTEKEPVISTDIPPEILSRLPNEILFKIALELPNEALRKFCITNTKLSLICKTDSFWLEKIKKDFSTEEFNRSYIPDNLTAKDYYKDLTNILSKYNKDPRVKTVKEYVKELYILNNHIKAVLQRIEELQAEKEKSENLQKQIVSENNKLETLEEKAFNFFLESVDSYIYNKIFGQSTNDVFTDIFGVSIIKYITRHPDKLQPQIKDQIDCMRKRYLRH